MFAVYQSLFSFSLYPAGKEAGVHKELGGDSWPQLTKGYPSSYHMTQHKKLKDRRMKWVQAANSVMKTYYLGND